jgi:hypothetical protein
MNSLQQQARFDDFLEEFSTERPHERAATSDPYDSNWSISCARVPRWAISTR